MFGKYNGFVSKARVSACMYFLVFVWDIMELVHQAEHACNMSSTFEFTI
jgi:uncharacterized membrane protein